MKVYSNIAPEAYAQSGCELRVHWNIEQVPAPSLDGADEMQWQANEALCVAADSRGGLIDSIIRSDFSVSDEIALINNATINPDAYAAYQAFRVLAKELADGWLAQRQVAV